MLGKTSVLGLELRAAGFEFQLKLNFSGGRWVMVAREALDFQREVCIR